MVDSEACGSVTIIFNAAKKQTSILTTMKYTKHVFK